MTMNFDQAVLAEPYLLGWLSSLGLDVEYTRAKGNTLWFRGPDGAEVPVLDFAGGYGSLMLGHHHPEIVELAQRLLASGVPVHAQFSRHPYAHDLASALNAIIRRELKTTDSYAAIFANSGAEAVEAAVKHAELDRVFRGRELADEIAAHIERARSSVATDDAVVSPAALEMLGLARETGVEEALTEVVRRNAEALARPPVLLSLEGSFHGKLIGSVQLTHNSGYRTPFSALSAQARFIPRDRPQALKEIVERERVTLFDISVENGVVGVVPRDAPVFCALLLEPIQGEGGIHVITEEFARAVQEICASVACPVIVDEVQSGMGRSGAFLAGSRIRLRGDYIVLAKSLGGGLAKASVLLVRQARYRSEFELVHSSTFAKDAFSCHIALKVLELLEADDGRAYRLAEERGAQLLDMFNALCAEFPDVLKEARGVGLMLGLEFHDQSAAASPLIREQAGTLGYAIAGHLLREHRIRTFPTASAVATLRFEPSVFLTDAEIGRLEAALRAVCALLREQDGRRLFG
jgi:acetylornithine/succinyldiaminopimelate/putrescine aminotransferase